MDVVFIHAIKESVRSVIGTLASLSLIPGEVIEKKGSLMRGDVVGLIGMVGANVNGTLVLSFETSTILHILEQMLGEPVKELGEDVLDAVGEITNMVAGDVKRRVGEAGYQIGMATPLVIAGSDIRVRDRVTRKTLACTFTTEVGSLVIESNLAAV